MLFVCGVILCVLGILFLNDCFRVTVNVSLECTLPTGMLVARQYSSSDLRYIGQMLQSRIKPDNLLLSRLKQLGVHHRCWQYRGKRKNRIKSRTWDVNNGVHHRNLLKVDISKNAIQNRNCTKWLTISTINSRSIRHKSTDILQYVHDKKVDVCVVTETWLHNDGDDAVRAELQQKGYSFDDVPRSGRDGGGLGLLCRDNLHIQRTDSGVLPSCEYSTWRISSSTSVISVFGVYRPPYSTNHRVTQAQFIKEITTILDKMVAMDEPTLLLGDLNLHFDKDDDIYTKQINDILQSYDMSQHVKGSTHVSGHTLDVIVSRNSDNINMTEPTAECFVSDHCFITCKISKNKPPLSTKTIEFRNWKSLNKNSFTTDLLELQNIISKSTDVDTLVEDFGVLLKAIVDKHAPLKRKTIVCRPEVPWFSSELKLLKHLRRSTERLHMRFNNEITAVIYRKMKMNYIKALASAKSKYYQDRIESTDGNTKKLYNVTSDLLGRKQDNPLPPIGNTEELADSFLDFFTNKITNIRKELDNKHIPLTADTTNHSAVPVKTIHTFNLLSEDEVCNIIKLSKSTTCELDLIPTSRLKEYLPILITIITEIINRSLVTGIFPQVWKNAVIRPLIKKKGLPLELQNYRPVSNLSFLSKVLEKAALRQIILHVDENNLLPSYQSAYRKHHGVETSMLKMYSDLLQSIDKKQVCIVVMIDLSAAFDTVDIPITLQILKDHFHIDGIPLAWFESYLTNRTMKVSINGSSSKTSELEFGVPQGSCAGPVIFTMYIAALKQVVNKYLPKLYGYADDHKLALTFTAGDGDSEFHMKNNLEQCLEDVIEWMAKNKLKMNNSKTEVIIYGTKHQISKTKIGEINVGGIAVKRTDVVRDLGVWMDSTLSFDVHIKKRCQLANHQLNNLKSIRNLLNKKSAETLVHGLIHSCLDFCNGLFVNLPNCQLDKLQTRCVRVTQMPPRQP